MCVCEMERIICVILTFCCVVELVVVVVVVVDDIYRVGQKKVDHF